MALKSLVVLNSVGFVILIALFFKNRFFCKFLCPVGCMLNMIPKRGKRKNNLHIKTVPSLNKLLAITSLIGAVFGFPLFIYLDPMSIFNGFFASFVWVSYLSIIVSSAGFLLLFVLQLIWPELWCRRLCPLGGLQSLASDFKGLFRGTKPIIEKKDMKRRVFIGSIIGATAGILFPFVVKGDETKIIRPPASADSPDFYALCTRCGSCQKACPTNIIKQDTRLGLGLLTPIVEFENGYCLETCNACSVVCPSGAISLFSVHAKSQLVMGKAEVNKNDCLLFNRTECDRCKAVCAYKAILIKEDKDKTLVLPEVDLLKCVGCGACKIICPQNCISIKI